MSSTFSVALCTYDGARFLGAQLDSIARQTLLPDELVVVDDGSTDATVSVLEAFATTAPFPVRLHRNPENLGTIKNFERAISLCEGEIIALADQDDVWIEEKLARLAAEFDNRPDAGLVFSNGLAVDAELHSLGSTLWDAFHVDADAQRDLLEGKALPRLLKQNVITGATLAFRRTYVPDIIPIPTTGLVLHDGWIGLTVAAVAPIIAIPDSLILYRQHEGQQTAGVAEVGRDARMARRHYLEHIALIEQIHTRFHKRNLTPVARELVDSMPAQAAHIRRRLNAPCNPVVRLFVLGMELLKGNYSRYSVGFRSFVRDLLWPIHREG